MATVCTLHSALCSLHSALRDPLAELAKLVQDAHRLCRGMQSNGDHQARLMPSTGLAFGALHLRVEEQARSSKEWLFEIDQIKRTRSYCTLFLLTHCLNCLVLVLCVNEL